MANRTVANLTAVLSMNNSKFKKGVSGSQKAMKGFSSQMMKIGGTIAAAFSVRAITNFTKASFRALDVQQKAEQSLLVSLNGRISAQRMLIKQAAELQKITLYGDEETIRAAALIGTMVKEEETIKRLLPLVQDFATAKGMQLSAAADLVAKSIGSSTNALSRYGITITGAVGSSERLETAVQALTTAFGGQAAAAADADVLMTQIKNSWGDFQESFAAWANEGGGAFFMRGLKGGVDDLNKLFSPKNAEAMAEFEKFMDSIKDEKPARQSEMLKSEIERLNSVVRSGAADRKALATELENYEGKFRRQKRIDTEQQIELIDQEQDKLQGVRRIMEEQLAALGKVNEGKDVEVKTQAEIFESWKKEVAIIQKRIELQKQLTEALNETKFARLDELEALAAASRESKMSKSSGTDAASYLLDNEEFWGGGTEAWEGPAGAVAKMEKSKAQVKEFGNMLSQTLVSQFDELGMAIGQFATGAEGAFKSLGDAIFQNLGNILIMLGAQTGNIPLVLLGAGLQLGGGILRGLGSKNDTSYSRTPANSSQQFTIKGNDLVTVMDRNMNRTARFT